MDFVDATGLEVFVYMLGVGTMLLFAAGLVLLIIRDWLTRGT